MIQLCYISTARPQVGWDGVDDILAVSRRNNGGARVSGLLLFNGKRFLQLLEGPAVQVEETYARILRDDRHFAIVKLSERQIDEREFGGWEMAFERFAAENRRDAIFGKVAELTRGASPSVKALFTSYAAI
ncbi:BLUF domain-containing protein [Sphingomonas sp. ID1715]|uniref:BLUF domain-containing protein n=1 Tax=Sphingomonas sp. ID1715 TaxID=1656898 RepID=UPI001489F580|nr:BLUF domain-containing protein [Sphingomonas sp. ID1715]NNM76300.1 BLUF domain-containing protein [Sphingomonas sp. ID1715]